MLDLKTFSSVIKTQDYYYYLLRLVLFSIYHVEVLRFESFDHDQELLFIAERDELRKDIEQLCIQQAGPSYLVVATKMHFQRYN